MKQLCDVQTCSLEAERLNGGGRYFLCDGHRDRLVPDILTFDGSLPFSQEYARWCGEQTRRKAPR